MSDESYDAMVHAKKLLKTDGSCIAPTGSCESCMIMINKLGCTPSRAYLAAKTFIEKNGKVKSIW